MALIFRHTVKIGRSKEGATSMEGVSMAGDEPKVNITLRECDILQISSVLKTTFRDELRGELTKTVKDIVDGVISGLSEQIKSLSEENADLRKENNDLKARIENLKQRPKQQNSTAVGTVYVYRVYPRKTTRILMI